MSLLNVEKHCYRIHHFANTILFRVKAILDANRNSLMLLDLKFSIGTIGIGSGAFIAGLFGMNLKTTMEESDMAFMGVTGFSSLVAMVICLWGLHKLRKIQRVSMWDGKRGQQNQASLTQVDPLPPSFPLETRHDRVKRLKFGNRRKMEAAQFKYDRSDHPRRMSRSGKKPFFWPTYTV